MTADGIIFDLDGTLWNATREIRDCWNKVITNNDNIRKPLELEELSGYMGLQLPLIAEKMFPNVDEKTRARLIEECCQVEQEYLKKHGATLYPKLEETLQSLKDAGIKLFIVSNCQEGYIECFLKPHNMEKYFEDFQPAGNGNTKGENNRLIMSRNGIKNAVYVGDTQGDAQSAIDADIPFILAGYGFGNAEKFDAKIDDISQLTKLFGIE